jgi:hypothetical protein
MGVFERYLVSMNRIFDGFRLFSDYLKRQQLKTVSRARPRPIEPGCSVFVVEGSGWQHNAVKASIRLHSG